MVYGTYKSRKHCFPGLRGQVKDQDGCRSCDEVGRDGMAGPELSERDSDTISSSSGTRSLNPIPSIYIPKQATPHHPATLSTHPLRPQPRSLPLHPPLRTLQCSPQQKKPSLTSSPQRPASISF